MALSLGSSKIFASLHLSGMHLDAIMWLSCERMSVVASLGSSFRISKVMLDGPGALKLHPSASWYSSM